MSICIVATDQALEQRVRVAAGDHAQVHRVTAESLRAELGTPASSPSGGLEVVLLGDELPVGVRLELVREFDQHRPDVSVVVVGDQDPGLWPRALRAGARDVLPAQAPEVEIRDVIERARNTATGRRRLRSAPMPTLPPPAPSVPDTGRVITVASPKGGCGKTTVATNVAVSLANLAPGDTVLVDLDLQFGDVASSLGLDPDHNVVDAVGGLAPGDSMVLKTYLDAHPSGCYVLCAPASPVDGEQVTGDQIGRLLDQLALDFRYVVVDTAPGLTEVSLAALEHSTDHVMVAGMDVRSVRGLRKELDVLAELDLASARRTVVVNLADKHSGLRLDDIEAVLGEPVMATLPRSRAAALSANRGVPLQQDRPRDPVARNLRRLVDDLVSGPRRRRKPTHRSRSASG